MDEVCILMATFNGATYLPRQLETIFNQVGTRVTLIVSDDGSSDNTLQVLSAGADRYGFSGNIHAGPCAGFAENFRFLITRPHIVSDFVAFADQDDVWAKDKLQAALAWLKSEPSTSPALYCSRTRSVSEDEKPLGFSPRFRQEPSLSNALVQSLGGGNTMVMNRSAFELVRQASLRTAFVSHDWWCYQIITAAGGIVHYDETSRIGYRQHDGNQVGTNNDWPARLRRIKHVLTGGYAQWSDQNIAALTACSDLLSASANQKLQHFARARSCSNALTRLYYLRKSGVYRQTVLGTLGLYGACVLGKL